MQKYTTFSKENNNQLKEPMFFGQPVNVARYDQQKYEVFEKLIEKQLSFFWRPEEVDVSKDRIDYSNMDDNEKHIFISNLKYQILLDSVQGRSPNAVFLPIVSLPELETWIETWSFSECLAEGTEVLTQDGWKDLAETTTKDECLVYNLDTGSVFYENPKRVVEYEVDTDLIHYKSKNGKQFEQLVTPNHRMPIIHRDRKKDGTQTKYFKEAIYQEYKSNHLAPISGWVNTYSDNLSWIERLLIATQADGTTSKRYTGELCGTIPVWFELTKERKCSRLKFLCEKAGVDIVTLSGGSESGSTRYKVSIPTKEIKGIDNLKNFDWVKLNKVSPVYCEQFLDELALWDSHRINSGSFTFSTTNESVAGVVQALSVMCRKSPRMVVHTDSRKESYKDLYSINILDRETKDGQSIEREYVKYKGKVRCLETSTGAFVIRYNGVVSITGNTIHSRSYTHIIRNIVNDPSVIFDDIMVNDSIMKRAESVSKYYDELYDSIQVYQVLGASVGLTVRDLKKKLYLCLMSVNVLEAIRFYVSFACSFAFAERKQMEGNAKIIKMIARDEALHTTGTQSILNLMISGRDGAEFKEIAEECHEETIKIFRDAAEQEKEWADYLFKDGSIIGLNKQILVQYIEYITNVRMAALGLPKLFDKAVSNPIPWINSWLSSDNVQVAPQETEISNYLVGQIDSDLSDDDFGGFEL